MFNIVSLVEGFLVLMTDDDNSLLEVDNKILSSGSGNKNFDKSKHLKYLKVKLKVLLILI